MSNDGSGADGVVTWELTGPDGKIKERGRAFNTITQVGDRRYCESGAGIAGGPAAPTGMRLGTGTTATAKTGAGSALVTRVVGGNKAFDATPTGAASGSFWRARYVCTYGPGTPGSAVTGIAEAVMVNDTIATDTATAEANTLARVLISPTINKGTADTLTITWDHTIGSAAT